MSFTIQPAANKFPQNTAFAVGGGTVCCFEDEQGVRRQPKNPIQIVDTLRQGPFALHKQPTHEQCCKYVDFLEAAQVISDFEANNLRAVLSNPPTYEDIKLLQNLFEITNQRYFSKQGSINEVLNGGRAVIVNDTFSEDITDEKADKIVADIDQIFRSGYEGILLTFGTDAVDRMLNKKLEKLFNENREWLSQRKDASGKPMSAVVIALTADDPLEALHADGWSNVGSGVDELERLLNSGEQHIGSFLPFHDRIIKGGNIAKSQHVNPSKIKSHDLLTSYLKQFCPYGNTFDKSASLSNIWLRSRGHMTFMSRDSDEFRILQEAQQHIKENQIGNLRRLFNGREKYGDDSVIVYPVNKFMDNHNELYSRIKPGITKAVLFVLNHSGTTYTNENNPELCVAALAERLYNDHGILNFAVTENAEPFSFYYHTYPGGLLLGNHVIGLPGMITGVAEYKAQLLCNKGYDSDYLAAAMLSNYVGEVDSTALTSYEEGNRHFLVQKVKKLPHKKALATEIDTGIWMNPIPAVALERRATHEQMVGWLGREHFLNSHQVVSVHA